MKLVWKKEEIETIQKVDQLLRFSCIEETSGLTVVSLIGGHLMGFYLEVNGADLPAGKDLEKAKKLALEYWADMNEFSRNGEELHNLVLSELGIDVLL